MLNIYKTIKDREVISTLSQWLLTIMHLMSSKQVASILNYANQGHFILQTFETICSCRHTDRFAVRQTFFSIFWFQLFVFCFYVCVLTQTLYFSRNSFFISFFFLFCFVLFVCLFECFFFGLFFVFIVVVISVLFVKPLLTSFEMSYEEPHHKILKAMINSDWN